MDFALLPPEINSGRLYAGPGAGPMLAAAAAWDQLAAELHSTAARYGAVLSALTTQTWQGPASDKMQAAAAPYVNWLSATGAQAEQAATQAKAAAAAFETAFAMTVPPAVVAANRSLLLTLIATNVLGQNTPAIAATEADYAEMWGQDATAMYGYAGSSAAASTFAPFTPPPPTADAAGLAGQGAAVAKAAEAPAQAILSNGPQLMSAVPSALQGLASAPAAADPASALSTALTALVVPLTAIDIPIAAASATASTTSASASFTSVGTTYRGLLINADRDYALGNGPFTGNGPGGTMLPEWIIGGSGGIGAPSDAAPSPVAAGLGRSAMVGSLPVPPGWASAAPAYRPVAYALPLAAANSASDIGAGGSSMLFGEMALSSIAGGAVGSTASPGRANERIRTISHNDRKQPSGGQSAPAAEIIAELHELAARANSLLTKLQNSAAMTDEAAARKARSFPS